MRYRDRAYIAGFFDGEGHVSVVDKRIHIYQKDPKVLHWIQRRLGYGKVNGPYKTGNSECCCLTIPAKHRVDFLTAVIPYLHVKKRDCLRLLEVIQWNV